MTGSLSELGLADPGTKLPLWRLVSGCTVLAILVALLVQAASVYVDNFLLDRYMRELAGQAESAAKSDADLTASILGRAHRLGLPVRANDIQITREGGHPHVKILKYTVQTKLIGMDLRLPEASSR